MSRSPPIPPDPRLLEVLPRITRAALGRAHAKRYPLDDDEIRSAVYFALFDYFRRHPDGAAYEHYTAAYMRVCGALIDEVRVMSGRRRTSGETKFGYDPAEVEAAKATGVLFRVLTINSEQCEYDIVDPAPLVEERLDEARTRVQRQRLLLEAKGCHDKERQAIRLLLEGMKQKDIAPVLGVTAARVSQLLSEGAAKIRRHYIEDQQQERTDIVGAKRSPPCAKPLAAGHLKKRGTTRANRARS